MLRERPESAAHCTSQHALLRRRVQPRDESLRMLRSERAVLRAGFSVWPRLLPRAPVPGYRQLDDLRCLQAGRRAVLRPGPLLQRHLQQHHEYVRVLGHERAVRGLEGLLLAGLLQLRPPVRRRRYVLR